MLMDQKEVLTRYQQELRTLTWRNEVLTALPHVTRRCAIEGESNMVTAFNLHEAMVDEVIQEEIAHFEALGQGFEWKVFSFDAPANLRERLEAAGAEVGEKEIVLMYDLADGLPENLLEVGNRAREVRTTDDLAGYRLVAEAVFEKDYTFTTTELERALREGYRSHVAFTAYADGQPVSIGRVYTHPESAFAGFYGGGTLPAFRHRGHYREVVAARAQFAIERGARFLQVDAMPTSLPTLVKLGFIPVAETWPCTFQFSNE